MNIYLDTSPPLRAILRDGPVLDEWAKWDFAITSAMFTVEARRTIDRLRLTRAYDDIQLADAMTQLLAIERSLPFLAVSEDVLERASRPMPTTVRTLDAIHLASAALIRDRMLPNLVFATHDRQQAIGARVLGFDVIGVNP